MSKTGGAIEKNFCHRSRNSPGNSQLMSSDDFSFVYRFKQVMKINPLGTSPGYSRFVTVPPGPAPDMFEVDYMR